MAQMTTMRREATRPSPVRSSLALWNSRLDASNKTASPTTWIVVTWRDHKHLGAPWINQHWASLTIASQTTASSLRSENRWSVTRHLVRGPHLPFSTSLQLQCHRQEINPKPPQWPTRRSWRLKAPSAHVSLQAPPNVALTAKNTGTQSSVK